MTRTTAIAAGLFLSISLLNAQEVMTTLKDCMEYAVNNSAKIKIQQADIDDARIARRDAVLRAFTPEISAGTHAYSNFGRSVDPKTNTYVSTTSFNNGYSISGGITLFNGFSAVNNMKITKTALKMGIRQEELIKDDLCLAIMQAYYNAVYCERLAEILTSRTETARNVLKLAKRQEELGQKGYAEVIEMEAGVADCEFLLISAKNRYADAILTLKGLMFWPIEQELSIDTSMAEAETAITLAPEYERLQTMDYAIENLPKLTSIQRN